MSCPVAGQGPALAAVAVGGALGALARFGAGLAVPFPRATFAINVTGCLLIGALLVVVAQRRCPPLLRPFLGSGVLGGFTTFSTYAVDVHTLVGAGRVATAGAYLAATLLAPSARRSGEHSARTPAVRPAQTPGAHADARWPARDGQVCESGLRSPGPARRPATSITGHQATHPPHDRRAGTRRRARARARSRNVDHAPRRPAIGAPEPAGVPDRAARSPALITGRPGGAPAARSPPGNPQAYPAPHTVPQRRAPDTRHPTARRDRRTGTGRGGPARRASVSVDHGPVAARHPVRPRTRPG